MSLNRTVIAGISVVAILVALTIAGGFWLTLERPDASATFINQCVQLIGLVTASVGIFAALNKIQKQTNGTLSAKEQEIQRLRQIALDAGADPQAVAGTTDVQH